MFKLSVIISTYNPNIERLNQTLNGLKKQNFPLKDWELILIDNNSSIVFINGIELNWHPNVKIVKEQNLGLTFARIKGFEESKSEIIIMVDDDNILADNYLSEVFNAFEQDPAIAALGGKSLPKFETTPPVWISKFHSLLALRDLGEKTIIEKWELKYPAFAPIGAGMGIRKSALKNYISKIRSNKSIITDRKGKNLSSGGDNDIILEIIKAGWKVMYNPILSLQHIIPKERTEPKYLGRLNKDSTKSWIILLNSHNINPWKKIQKRTLYLRKIKAWLIYKPWLGPTNYINYQGVSGMYEALSEI